MAAVDTLAAMPAQRRIVVAGEMLELGTTSEELHRECGRYVARQDVDFLLGVRGLAKAVVEGLAGMAWKRSLSLRRKKRASGLRARRARAMLCY